MIDLETKLDPVVEHSLAELEFDKVRSKIASFSVSALGEEHILGSYPSPDTAWLREEHSRVDELLALFQRGEDFSLDGLVDTRALLAKTRIENVFLSASELLAVRDVIRLSRVTKSALEDMTTEMPSVSALGERLHADRMLEKHIADAIDEGANVKDSASRELASIRAEIADISSKLRIRLQRLLRKVAEEDVVMDEYITQREGRFVLPMKTEYKRHIPGIIHGVSNSGSTVFVEPSETFDMNNELSILANRERREIERILTLLTKEVAEQSREFTASLEVLGHLDAVRAKARYAYEFGGLKPSILDEPGIYARELRHPLLVQAKGRKNVVPMSVEFASSTPGHLISGPNAGGKTVALKCLGLSVAMALSGFFPLGELATDYREVFTAIGDNQSIENDVSTFSSQLLRLREILMAGSPTSLILVDEICSGTDPQEGAALAVGIMDGFLARGAFFIVTTHQSSLKSYALARNEISNASMQFDVDKMEPTYKFLSGVPGNSYAFALAKRIGLPPGVMSRAQDYLGDKHSELEKSIEVIQQYRHEVETLRNEVVEQKRKAETKREEYERKFADFKARYNDLVRAAKAEAADIVSQANALVENTIREIREQNKPVAEVKKAFDAARSEIRSQASSKQATQDQAPEISFADGDVVTMEGHSTPGVVVSVEQGGKSAVVEFDSVKFRVSLASLKHSNAKPKPRRVDTEVRLTAGTQIDVRGQYADQAILEVEQAIAEALMGSVYELTIIHGKGTGALRTAIQRELARHPGVTSFRDGSITEGGSGVTVAVLKS